MKKKMIVVMFVILLSLIGCQNQDSKIGFPIPDGHKSFLATYGWEIDHSHSYHLYSYLTNINANELSIYKEFVNEIKKNTGLELSLYFEKQAILQMGYVLKNNKTNYDWIQAYLYEVEGEVVGGYLVVYKSGDIPKEIPMTDKVSIIN